VVRLENYLSILVSLFFSKRRTTVQGVNCLVNEAKYVLGREDAYGMTLYLNIFLQVLSAHS
jgi:hypothetical protein